jgi:NADPH-dependent 2,4-dienoyl-CoA reductase/sulfur reductase-like enzyme
VSELGQIVVVGAGLAGLRAVETLRREGYERRVVLVGDETEPPYDRPPLSKEVLLGTRAPETIYLRPPERLDELGVELVLGRPAHDLDLEAGRIGVGDETLSFDGLIVATGASPRTLPLLEGRPHVHTLRTLEDALRLRAAMEQARHVTVVGAGFIGSEVAASARGLGLDVTILELDTTPLARAIGHELGHVLMRLHEENGTELRLGMTVESVEDEDTSLLRLTDGTLLETDLVVVGVGVIPEIAWLEGSGLELGNGVVCDAALNAGRPGVFAVGDLANWPNELFGRRMRVEHWTNASDQARHAARNLLRGEAEPFVGSNYVWSDQYGLRIQFVGISQADEVVIVDGSTDEHEFVAWYREGDRLVGALGVGSPQLLMQSKRLIEERRSWTEALAALES